MSDKLGDPADWDTDLPNRLFGTDRYPQKGRLNVYSRPDILSFVQEKLKGTPEWDKLLDSQFGALYNIPTSWCPISCQLLHCLLSRQLVTSQKYQLWTVFDGKPLRFSLVEFSELTGLNCSNFRPYYNPDPDKKAEPINKKIWNQLIGADMKATLGDISNLLGDSKKMSGWKRLGLALILIVDGVLIANRQYHRPTPRYVNMMEDQDAFLKFPWGRESFLKTITSMRPDNKSSVKCPDPVVGYRQQLQQTSLSLKGFPLVLQLLAFTCIPKLLDHVPNGTVRQRLYQLPFKGIGKLTLILRTDVIDVEHEESLSVQPMLELSSGFEDGWAMWCDGWAMWFRRWVGLCGQRTLY